MALKLYVRGASADVAVPDLGITVAQGPSWTQLNYSSPADAEGDSGQFTARELRDSGDLFDLISGGTLEWSKDGTNVASAGDYKADYMITEDFTDDRFNLENGELIFPHSDTLPSSGVEGQIYWKDDSDEAYVYDGTSWQLIGGEAMESMYEPTGFANRTDSQFSFVNGTRTFTIQPVSSQYDIFFSGRKVTKTGAENVVITDTEGLHYIYFDDADDTLKSTTTFSTDIITRDVFVAAIYWDADNNTALILGEERHGITMDGATHSYLHQVFGAQWVDGLALGGMTVNGTGNDNTHAQFAVTNGSIRDEDIVHTVTDDSPQDLDPTAEIPIFYRDGASGVWRKKTADAYPLIYSGDSSGYTGANGRLPYNEWTGSAWQLTEVSQLDYVLMHYFATNDVNTPIIGVVGQNQYTSLGSAQTGATTEMNELVVDGLPSKEFVPLATVIYQTSTTYSNTPAARVISTAEGDDYIDWRFTVVNPSGGVSTGDHGNLTGLNDDDHTRYFDLTGDKTRNVVSSDDGVTWNGDFDAASGILTIPHAADVAGTFTSGGEGDVAWDSDDDLPYWHDGSNWVSILTVLSGVLDHDTLLNVGTYTHTEIDSHIDDSTIHFTEASIDHGSIGGLGDDDHTQYLLLSGDLGRNIVTGGIDLSTASGLIIPQGTGTAGQTPTEGNIFWDSDDDALYMYDGAQWITIATSSGVNTDHGALTGLLDDDHTQYLTEGRHDSLPADNPHSVTFTQAVTADSGTDITAAEAETLTDGSNADLLHEHDHGALSGIDDDDHTQYVLIDGDLTRNQFSDGGINLASASGLILPTGTDTTGLATVEGNIMWDTDDDLPYFYDGAQWSSITNLLSGVFNHHELAGLGDDDHTQYLTLTGDKTRNNITGSLDLSGGDYLILPQATDISGAFLDGEEGALAWDTDHDVLYAHNGSQWIGIAPASGIITDHGALDGLGDDDHTQYTAWAQDETVTGVWTFDPVDDEPNLILEPRTDAPIYNLTDGAIAIVGGILYIYDGTRSKWLSMDRVMLQGGRRGSATNIYMRIPDNIATSQTGLRMLRDGTITGLVAQTESSATWTFEVRRNGSVIASLTITAASGDQATDTNVDFSQGDELQLYCNGTSVPSPVGMVEVAWRI